MKKIILFSIITSISSNAIAFPYATQLVSTAKLFGSTVASSKVAPMLAGALIFKGLPYKQLIKRKIAGYLMDGGLSSVGLLLPYNLQRYLRQFQRERAQEQLLNNISYMALGMGITFLIMQYKKQSRKKSYDQQQPMIINKIIFNQQGKLHQFDESCYSASAA